jgi:hypothetical protein
MFQQAKSPVIRVPNQALTREGGEQGGAAALRCLLAGGRAHGLSWEHTP